VNGFDNFGQQPPRRTDKWFTLLIFFKTRTFPNKYKLSRMTAGAEDNVFAILGQPAALTISQVQTNILQGFANLLRFSAPAGQFFKTAVAAVKPPMPFAC
jgi:hypothetical protein